LRYVSDGSNVLVYTSYKLSLNNFMFTDLRYLLSALTQQIQRGLRDILSVLHMDKAINFILYAGDYNTLTSITIPTLTLTSILLTEFVLIFVLSYHNILGLLYFKFRSKFSINSNSSSKLLKPSYYTLKGRAKYLLTVVIPIRNEPLDLVVNTVKNGLKPLRESENVEILIISDDDENYLRELRRRLPYSNVRVIKGVGRGRSSALDLGYKLARTPYVMYVDADARLKPNVANEILKRLREGSEDVVVIPWRGYYNKRTKLGEAYAYLTSIYSFLYHNRTKDF